MKFISARHQAWKLIVLILTLSLGFIACEKDAIVIADPAPQDPIPDTSTTAAGAVQYLALGDSYTIGESVPVSQRFPLQLANQLRQDSFVLEEVRIVARTGWTTDELASGILKADLPDTSFNLVSLLIGVNNQYRGRSLENYREEFTTLLLRAIELAGDRPERVIVLSIPDYGVTPFVSSEEQAKRIAEEIDAFNDAAAQICLAQQVRFLNITPISRRAATDDSLIASDGLHPSGKMYGLWVDEMLPIVKNMLK